MSMVVKNNMSAISTLNTLNKNSSALSKSLQKVSSGMKINSAADDASGYAISERMRVQIRSLDQANANTQSGNSMMKVAEGAVSSTVDILKTLKEKVINAANDTNTDSDRQTIQKELDQSIDQIDDNANVTFNGKYLLDGSKNNVGEATYTALSNQNLSKSTTADTKLVDLKARNEDSLELLATDRITVSYVQAGKTYSATFQVGDKTLQDIFNEAENIDTDSQIFATSSNEAIQKASGVTNASTTDAENKAIAYLQSQLGDGTQTAGAFNAVDAPNGVYGVTGNYQDAEDITVDFFIKLWDLSERYTPGGGHKRWMTVIARNMALDYLRSRGREVPVEPQEMGTQIDADPQIEKGYDEVIEDMSLAAALDSLTPAEREVVHMKVIGDLTFKHIAEILRIPMGTVTWRYRQAISKLRRCGYEAL